MKYTLIAVLFAIFACANAASAADVGCESRAADKHLAGAAKTSFMKKCEKDAAAASAKEACANKAADKKLAGAAKSSFVKKCEKDAAK